MRWRIGAVVAAFGVVSVLVHTHASDPVDLWAYRHLYPDQHWGLPQMAGDVLVNLLQPAVTGVAFVLLAWRRSRSAVPGALLRVAVVSVLVAFLKWFFDRPDVHGSTAHLGGSYPSGHMVSIVAYGGPWWLAALLALALLVTGTHWLTDVVAGVLTGWLIRQAFRRLHGERRGDAGRHGGAPHEAAALSSTSATARRSPRSRRG